MRAKILDWVTNNRILLQNSGAVIGAVGVTSGLGFVYWWVAARAFSKETVGFASAAISAMMLLGMLGVLGLGTWLIGEFARRPEQKRDLVATSVLASGGVAFIGGWLFAVLSPYITTEIQALGLNIGNQVIFAGGVALTTVAFVSDDALLGLLLGAYQFGRNAIFSASKLLFIIGLAWWATRADGMAIYLTWVMGNVFGFIFLIFTGLRARVINFQLRPRLTLLRGGHTALGHHIINLSIHGLGYALSLVITILFSAEANASFYLAWLIANFMFLIPNTFTMVLYAMSGKATSEELSQKLRLTVLLSFVVGLGASVFFVIFANLLMGIFGADYANQGGLILTILTLGVFPLIVKMHYISLARIHNEIGSAALITCVGIIFELSCAALGGILTDSLIGLCLAWLIALSIEIFWVLPIVYHAAQNQFDRINWYIPYLAPSKPILDITQPETNA